MGNFNPNYFDRKAGSLERAVLDAVNGVKTQIDETNKNNKSDDGDGMDKVQPKAVKKKFDDRKDKDIDNDGDIDLAISGIDVRQYLKQSIVVMTSNHI